MSAALLIARRELRGYLRTMTGWIIAASVLLIDGLLFNAFAMEGARRSTEVLTRFFYFASGPTMVAAIFLAMRLLAEERQLGTLPLLYSSPVRDRDIVIGKFLGAALLVSLLVAWLLASVTEPPFSALFASIALWNAHFPSFQAGQVNLRDVAYYLLVTWVALFATTRVLEARRWR